MSKEHRTLTGASLHENKGVDTALVDYVATSDGAGATVWKKLTAPNFDTGVLPSSPKTYVSIQFDLNGTYGAWMPIPISGTISKIYFAVDQVISSTGSVTLTFANSSSLTMGTHSFSNTDDVTAGSSITPTTNNSFTAGQTLKITWSTGMSASAIVHVVFEVTPA